jgi:hypothetical protein
MIGAINTAANELYDKIEACSVAKRCITVIITIFLMRHRRNLVG